MTVYGSQILQRSQTQHGKPYRFGAEVQIGLTWFFQAKAWDCLTADTIVHTARGPVRIDEVEVGDAVWSWDEANLRPHKIERVEERPASPCSAFAPAVGRSGRPPTIGSWCSVATEATFRSTGAPNGCR